MVEITIVRTVQVCRRRRTSAYRGKRFLDLTVSIPLAVVLLPVVVLVGFVSLVVFRSWPVFRQGREGLGGTEFTMLKIRSLNSDVPTEHPKTDGNALRTNFFGRLIRKYHVDELIQVFQVVSGDMSLVGPRPEMLPLIDRYSDEHLTARRAFKPGLTGLWQLSPDASRMMYEVPEYDLYYVSNWSLRLDVWILVLTAMQPLRSVTPRLFSWVERHTFALGRGEVR